MAEVLSLTPHMPVGLAMTWVTLTTAPSGWVVTPTEVNTGGTESDVCPAESVVVTNCGDASVVSGWSVIVLTEAVDLSLA